MTNTPTLTTIKDEAETVAWRYFERDHWIYTDGPNRPHPGNSYPVRPLFAHPPTAIVDEGMMERAKRQIILAMQMQDFGHNGTGGDFNTNPRKIELLEACAETAARSVLALSAALQAGDGTGMVLVPAEPTQEMLEAGSDAQMLYSHPRKIWQAMLSASSGGTRE